MTKTRVQARIDEIVGQWKVVFDRAHPAQDSSSDDESVAQREE